MIQLMNEEKYAIISILTQIMNADGVVHPKEEEFLNKFFKEHNVKIKDIEDISAFDEYESRDILREMTSEKLEYAHSLFMSMAEADGYVHPKELEVINNIVNASIKQS